MRTKPDCDHRMMRSSVLTILLVIFLETVLLSTVSNCAKTFYMHWNTSNSIFRIDNTDHIIDVNKGNLAFEFDQVHIICPVYEPGTFENETERYIIYNVSKVEYETCRITNADPRVIAICDKPQKLMFFTITFRPFTPQPGGLEFLPGNDYYFISTSSKDDLYRRIGGRCSTNNMKVVFKVCCTPEDSLQSNFTTTISSPTKLETDEHMHKTNRIEVDKNQYNSPSINSNISNVVRSTVSWSTPIVSSTIPVRPNLYHPPFLSSPNPSHDQKERNPLYSNKPTKKINDLTNKHPNDVVKNEELTYNKSPVININLCLIMSLCSFIYR